MSESMIPVVSFVADDSKLEPHVTDVRTRTVVISDRKGGKACLDISEVADVQKSLASLLTTDAPEVTVLDLTQIVNP